MMMPAQALPVALIPEQFLVAAVWNNVIHNRCFGVASLLSTFRTQRVALKERFACLLPAAAVAALCGRPCYLRMERPVFLAKLCSRLHKRWTSGMSTGNSWSLRNGYHHLHSHKKAPAILQMLFFIRPFLLIYGRYYFNLDENFT